MCSLNVKKSVNFKLQFKAQTSLVFETKFSFYRNQNKEIIPVTKRVQCMEQLKQFSNKSTLPTDAWLIFCLTCKVCSNKKFFPPATQLMANHERHTFSIYSTDIMCNYLITPQPTHLLWCIEKRRIYNRLRPEHLHTLWEHFHADLYNTTMRASVKRMLLRGGEFT